MDEALARTWIAMTNHRKFTITAPTFEQAAAQFQEKMGYHPEPWQLELMETSDDPIPEGFAEAAPS